MRIEIPLTRGYVAIIDEEDLPLVEGHKWRANGGMRAGRDCRYALAHVFREGRWGYAAMHRLIARPGPGMCVDHIDGDGLHNWRDNLRVCSHRENIRNKRKSPAGKFPYKGIEQGYGNNYYATLSKEGTRYRAGGFRSVQEAARAYDKLAIKHFGEFALLNFPREKQEAA